MEIIRCSNGHFYDSSEYHTCPRCEQERNGGGGMKSSMFIGTDFAHDSFDNNRSASYGSTSGFMPTEAFQENGRIPTQPADSGSSGQCTTGAYPKTEPANKGFAMPKTEPVGPIFNVSGPGASQAAPITPVVGWIVCIDGPTKGKDYRIFAQNNYIGRNKNMDISIPEDPAISGENSALIGYHNPSKTFFFGLASGHNMVTINDRVVFNAERIQAYDILGVGNSKFIFVPLCGDQFDWDGR